jgi:hypothetical protein
MCVDVQQQLAADHQAGDSAAASTQPHRHELLRALLAADTSPTRSLPACSPCWVHPLRRQGHLSGLRRRQPGKQGGWRGKEGRCAGAYHPRTHQMCAIPVLNVLLKSLPLPIPCSPLQAL